MNDVVRDQQARVNTEDEEMSVALDQSQLNKALPASYKKAQFRKEPYTQQQRPQKLFANQTIQGNPFAAMKNEFPFDDNTDWDKELNADQNPSMANAEEQK